MSSFNQESVTGVHHWTDNLFSFTTTRDPSFRFRNGEFTMIGLEVGKRPLLRAYSVASANYEDRLEFFSIKVPDGPLTSRLQHLKIGDPIIVSRKATGTLVIDNLESGRNLYLVGTGTGLAPFLSVIKDPETYERFERVVLVHMRTAVVPWVHAAERVQVQDLGRGFWEVRVNYGFMQRPDIPRALALCASQGLPFDLDDTTFFLGRETIIPTRLPGMALWRERLFSTLARNASSPVEYFNLPANRVIELGMQIEV